MATKFRRRQSYFKRLGDQKMTLDIKREYYIEVAYEMAEGNRDAVALQIAERCGVQHIKSTPGPERQDMHFEVDGRDVAMRFLVATRDAGFHSRAIPDLD